MLILAGVAIILLTGENGIVTKANEAKIKSAEEQAKEKLGLVLNDIMIEKRTNSNYEDKQYKQKLAEEGITILVDGSESNIDIVLIDEWKFQVDRTIPKIVNGLGKGEINEQIQIKLSTIVSADYIKSTLTIEITYKGEIESVTLNEERLELPIQKDEKYTITKEINKNGNYNVIVKDKEGKLNTKSIRINEIVGDLDIYNAEQLAQFRDNVNRGVTYEQKTITLRDNIDMSSIRNWEPIGNEKNSFKGTFNGNGKEIRNFTIDNTNEKQGLFSHNAGTIENLGMDKRSKVKIAHLSGAIVGWNELTGIVRNCYNKGMVTGTRESFCQIGGLVGLNNGEVTRCYNEGIIQGESKDDFVQTGGIVGVNGNNGIISECYNKGEIISIAKKDWSTAGGIAGIGYEKSVTIRDCYNRGTIRLKTTGKQRDLRIGGVVGDIAGTNFTNAYNIGKIIVEDAYGSYIQIGGTLGCTQRSSVVNNIWCLDEYKNAIGRFQRRSRKNYKLRIEIIRTNEKYGIYIRGGLDRR